MVSISRLVPGTGSSSGSKPAMISTSSAGRRLEASVVARRKRASVSETGCMAWDRACAKGQECTRFPARAPGPVGGDRAAAPPALPVSGRRPVARLVSAAG